MSSSVISDATQATGHSPPNRYHSKMYEDFRSSPTSTHYVSSETHTHARSPSMGTSTLAPSALSELSEEKSRHFSDGSQVGYAEIVSPEPQFIDTSHLRNSDKEAYRKPVHSTSSTTRDGTLAPIMDEDEDAPAQRKRRCGMTVPVFWVVILGVVILILALALGLGLGLGLKKKSSSSDGTSIDEALLSQTMIGGTINPRYYSTAGAFNGSGIAIASTSSGLDPDIFVFYQDHAGAIKQILWSTAGGGKWIPVVDVATNARNATPIAAVAYVDPQGVAFKHVFYIDKDNHVRQKYSSDAAQSQDNIWMEGSLNDLNLESIDDELVGLQACYWGNYYGSASNFSQGSRISRSQPATGMNLWYASDNSTFTQYDWTIGQNRWNKSDTFTNKNTHAGIGCQSWLSGATQYLWMVDTNNTIRIQWRDNNINETSTPEHPIAQWTYSDVSITDVHPSTSLGYTDYLAYQTLDGLFHGVDIEWAAEDTRIANYNVSTGADTTSELDVWVTDARYRGISGSHMAVTALNQTSGGRQIVLFYQSIDPTDGGMGMTMQLRDSSPSGGWSTNFVPVNGTNT